MLSEARESIMHPSFFFPREPQTNFPAAKIKLVDQREKRRALPRKYGGARRPLTCRTCKCSRWWDGGNRAAVPADRLSAYTA